MNKVILRGRLGQDPELKYTTSGTAVCNLNLATTKYSGKDDQGNRKEKTEWHRLVCWKGTAEFAHKFLKKGSNILIEGELATRTWEDKQGNKRYTTEVQVSQIENLTPMRADGGHGTDTPRDANTEQRQKDIASDNNFCSDDIPF